MHIIKRFEPEDIFSIIKLASETLPEQYSPSLFNYFFETYPEGFIVAEKNHKIIGFIVGVKLISDDAKILMLAVSENIRRQNVGSDLFNSFLNEISKQKIKSVELEVRTDNVNAVNFYKKQGFKIIETLQNFYQNGEDAYQMKKIIRV